MGSASPREIGNSEASLIQYRKIDEVEHARLEKSDAKVSKNAGLWRVVELTEELKVNPEKLEKLLGTRNWDAPIWERSIIFS